MGIIKHWIAALNDQVNEEKEEEYLHRSSRQNTHFKKIEYLSSITKYLEVKKIAELTLSMQIGSDATS